MRFWEGHAPHTISLIDLKFDTQVQLNVLYKKGNWTRKLRLPRFFANLHNVKNSKMNRTFERLTLSTLNLVYSFGGCKDTFLQ